MAPQHKCIYIFLIFSAYWFSSHVQIFLAYFEQSIQKKFMLYKENYRDKMNLARITNNKGYWFGEPVS